MPKMGWRTNGHSGRAWPATRVLAVALLAAVTVTTSCGRRRESIGRLSDERDGGGAPKEAGGDLGREAGGGPSDGTDDPDAEASACATTNPALAAVATPAFTCGMNCLGDPAVKAQFAGVSDDPDPAHRPDIVYPLADSVHPPFLPTITLQWVRAPGGKQTAFRLTLATPGTAYEIYTPYREVPPVPVPVSAESVLYEVPRRVWRWLARTHAGEEVVLRIAALDPEAKLVATSGDVRIAFAPAAIEGGLYYLAASRGISRNVFGATGADVVVPPSSAGNHFNCGGCHGVSRNGEVLAFSATYAGNLTITRTLTPAAPVHRPPDPPVDVSDGYAPAVSPDGRWVIARARSGAVTVWDTSVSPPAIADEKPLAFFGGRLDHPEFSPDGASVVAGRASGVDNQPESWSAIDGHLVTMPFANGQLGAPAVLVESPSEVLSHPSFSPDGRWVVFVAGERGLATVSNPRTRLRLIRSAGGPSYELHEATRGRDELSTYPKFAPTLQRQCNLMFIVFQSRMSYGFLAPAPAADPRTPHLWLAAIDLERLASGDPSRAPVWLPFQDLADRNLQPTWTTQVPCTTNAPGLGECGATAYCAAGRCVPRVE